MEVRVEEMEKLLHGQIMLYGDLLECLDRERRAIKVVNMEVLWEIAAEKEAVLTRIAALRRELHARWSRWCGAGSSEPSVPSLERVAAGDDGPDVRRLRQAFLSLAAIKGEVGRRSVENKGFVQDCLDFLDELFGIIAGAGKASSCYGKQGPGKAKMVSRLLLNQEA